MVKDHFLRPAPRRSESELVVYANVWLSAECVRHVGQGLMGVVVVVVEGSEPYTDRQVKKRRC